MEPFRRRNKALVYLLNFSGLYMKSIETFISNRVILIGLKMWSFLPLILIPTYLGSAAKVVLLDDLPFKQKFPIVRRLFAFSSYFAKNIFFFFKIKRIEKLIDLWDMSFQDEFYNAEREETFAKISKRFRAAVPLSYLLNVIPALTYSVPPFFFKTKKLSHPTAFSYRNASPDYELMVIYDFFRVMFGCCLASAFDCLLIAFLSAVLSQLTHLKECLGVMVDEARVEVNGSLTFKRGYHTAMEGTRETSAVGQMDVSGNENSALEKISDEFQFKLKIWISHHQQTLRYFEELKNLYGPMASIQFIHVICYTCFTAFHLASTKASVNDIIVITFIAISNLISLFWWCKIGDAIEDVNSNLFGDGFSGAWFVLSKKTLGLLQFIVMRGRKRLGLRGLSIYLMNSNTFFEIIKVTYQLFAFIQHVYH